MASLLLKENNHYPVLVQLRGCLAWEERMIFVPLLPLWEWKMVLCLQSLLQNYFVGDRSTFYKIQLGWQGRQGKQIHTKWKWLHGSNAVHVSPRYQSALTLMTISYKGVQNQNHRCTFYCGFHRALASYNRQSFQNMELQKQNHYYLTWDTDVHQSWAMLGQQWHP